MEYWAETSVTIKVSRYRLYCVTLWVGTFEGEKALINITKMSCPEDITKTRIVLNSIGVSYV